MTHNNCMLLCVTETKNVVALYRDSTRISTNVNAVLQETDLWLHESIENVWSMDNNKHISIKKD